MAEPRNHTWQARVTRADTFDIDNRHEYPLDETLEYLQGPVSPLSTPGLSHRNSYSDSPYESRREEYSPSPHNPAFLGQYSRTTSFPLPTYDRRHSVSNSDVSRVSENYERRRSSADWSPSWGERPRSSIGSSSPSIASIINGSSYTTGYFGASIAPTNSNMAVNREGGLDYTSIIRTWLNPVDFQLERLQLQRQRTLGTFEWLVTSNVMFKRWLEGGEDSPSILWFCDRPGSGKSVAVSLMLQAIENHCTRAKATFAYTFGKRANRLNATPTAIDFIKSIAFQIFRAFPIPKGSVLPPPGWSYYLRNSAHIGSINTVVGLLSDLLKGRKTYIIVDGVDECTEAKVVMEHLTNLPSVIDGNTKILISTRQRPDAFDDENQYPVVTLTPPHGQKSADLRLFVEEEIEKIEGLHRTSQDFSRAVNNVINASDGLFLWASALVKELKNQQHHNVWSCIDRVPNEIKIIVKEELWKIWQRPESKRRLSLEVLEWTIFCLKPLFLAQFPFGRHFDSDGSFLDYEHRRIDRKKFLLRFSSDFLTFPTLDGRFCLFHPKIADYIIQCSLDENPQFQLTDGPVRIALSCIRYLSSTCFVESFHSERYKHSGLHSSHAGGAKGFLRSRHHCLEYSSLHLIDHLLLVTDVASKDGAELVEALVGFILSSNASTWLEAAQIFDPEFAMKFISMSESLEHWIEGVIMINYKWRNSLSAIKERLLRLKFEVGTSGGYAMYTRGSGSTLSVGRGERIRDRIRDRSRSPAAGLTEIVTRMTNLSTSPTSTSGVVSAVSASRSTRRTREEIEHGLPAGGSQAHAQIQSHVRPYFGQSSHIHQPQRADRTTVQRSVEEHRQHHNRRGWFTHGSHRDDNLVVGATYRPTEDSDPPPPYGNY